MQGAVVMTAQVSRPPQISARGLSATGPPGAAPLGAVALPPNPPSLLAEVTARTPAIMIT